MEGQYTGLHQYYDDSILKELKSLAGLQTT